MPPPPRGGKHVLDSICRVRHTLTVKWEVDFHDDFVPEYHELPQDVQDELLASIKVLEEFGPQLGRPQVDTLKGSRHHNMKELRFDAGGVCGGLPSPSIPTGKPSFCAGTINPTAAKNASIAN